MFDSGDMIREIQSSRLVKVPKYFKRDNNERRKHKFEIFQSEVCAECSLKERGFVRERDAQTHALRRFHLVPS